MVFTLGYSTRLDTMSHGIYDIFGLKIIFHKNKATHPDLYIILSFLSFKSCGFSILISC